jgi:hypothetical protein
MWIELAGICDIDTSLAVQPTVLELGVLVQAPLWPTN